MKSDEIALWFALAEFQLEAAQRRDLQLPRGSLWSWRSSLLAAGSEAEGTCNLMLGETLPPKINKMKRFHRAVLNKAEAFCMFVIVNKSHEKTKTN